MATYTKIADAIEHGLESGNFATDTLRIALSNTAPGSESSNPTTTGNGVLANVTQISYTNYADSLGTDRTLESVTSSTTSGTYRLDCADFTISASGGTLATWQYLYIYDDTMTSPADGLIALYTMASAVSLSDGSSIALTLNANGIFQVS